MYLVYSKTYKVVELRDDVAEGAAMLGGVAERHAAVHASDQNQMSFLNYIFKLLTHGL